MGTTSSLDLMITPFESGMLRLVLWSVTLSWGIFHGCGPLLTLPMGAASSPDAKLVLQLAVLLRGTLVWFCLLHALSMGTTSSPDPLTPQFKLGMLRLVFQLAILSMDTPPQCGPLLTHLMGATSPPNPLTPQFKSGMPRLVLQSALDANQA